jgi:predicted ribosome quality control (RQC) complex YloA/Tae2 family protein
MKQAYGQLNNQIKKLESILTQAPVRVQKIYALPNFIVIEIYARHCNELYLYLGTGKQFQCFFSSVKKPPINFRIPSKFRSLINKYFSGQMLLTVKSSSLDRIFTMSAGGKVAPRISFYWSGGRLYFIYGYREKEKMVFKYSWLTQCDYVEEESWEKKIEGAFASVGKLELISKDYESFNYEEFLHNYFFEKSDNKIKQKKINDLNKKKNRIEKNLEQLYKLEELKQWLLANLDIEPVQKLKELGIRQKFLQEDSLYKKRSKLFDKIKNSAIDVRHLEKINNEMKNKLFELDILPDKVVNIPPAVHPKWDDHIDLDNRKESKSILKLEYKIYVLHDGTQIGFGLSDQGNDMLRNKWTKKNDYWFHVHKKPSAHAWIRTENGLLDLNSQSIMVVAYLLASEQDNTEIDIMYAKREHVKSQAGQVGGVKVSTYKVLRLYTTKSVMELIAQVL